MYYLAKATAREAANDQALMKNVDNWIVQLKDQKHIIRFRTGGQGISHAMVPESFGWILWLARSIFSIELWVWSSATV